MDPITIVGIGGGTLIILIAAVLEGANLIHLMSPTAAMIILGGTTGATMACYSLDEMKEIVASTRMAFRKPPFDMSQVIETFVELATLVRREGLLMLENYPVKIDSPLLKRGLQLMVDGTDPNMLKDMLATQIAVQENQAKTQASIWQTAGGFAPTMGIIGTVIGLVHVLGNLSEPAGLGEAISVAFLATLYGIGTAYLVFLPLGKKMTFVAKQNVQLAELVVEGITSIQTGENPRVIEEKLYSYLDENTARMLRAKRAAAKDKK
ncbi:MAG: flagellar motor protein [FCB group bacterium]|nr:flagellar motor protein [FCB group bacterium]